MNRNRKWFYVTVVLTAVALAAALYLLLLRNHKADTVSSHPQEADKTPHLTVAIMPDMDCLPVAVAYARGLFERKGLRVKLLCLNAQMDCDTALTGGSAQIIFTDMVRAERMKKKGVAMDYLTTTNGKWQLIANKGARLTDISQLGDKMVAMTRYSGTDLLTTRMLQKAKVKNTVFRVQVNDVQVRLNMILTGAMDAAWLSEPQATVALANGHKTLPVDTGKDVIKRLFVSRSDVFYSMETRKWLDAFVVSYNEAVDSINRFGLPHYADVCEQLTHVPASMQKKIPTQRYTHVRPPSEQEVNAAR